MSSTRGPVSGRTQSLPKKTAQKTSSRSRARKAPRFGLRWKLSLAALLVLSLLLFGSFLARKFAPVANTDRTHFDTLIVLGYPDDADGNPSPRQLARVNEAVREYERGVAPHIIVTGGAAHNHFVEAETMARTAQAAGIPSRSIVIEGNALDTIQNACYATRLMQKNGWSSAEVISSASHLPRAALIFKGMPIEWRMHAAPPLGSSIIERWRLDQAAEVIKTMRFFLWARLTERCQP